MYCNGIQSYRKTNVVTADPMRLVIMCYEGAVDSLKLAKQKIDEKDYEAKAKAINKTKDIIDELLCALDIEKGGVIAKNLNSLYNYMTRRIIHGDVNQDMGAIDEVIGILSELLSAWQGVASKPDTEIRVAGEGFYEDRMPMAAKYVSA